MMRKFADTLIILLLFMAVTSSNSYSAMWKPSGTVEFIVPTSAGSGIDNAARAIHRIWQKKKMVDVKVVVINKKGAGGAIAFTYMNKHAGNGHYILISQPNILTNHIQGKTPIHFKDTTPIAQLFTEYFVLMVNKDSPIKSGKGLIKRLKKNPKSVSFGSASSRGNANHMGLGLPLKIAGVNVKKLKVVIFSGGGKAVAAALGGHVDVTAVGAGRVVSPLKQGKLRVLVATAPKRLGGPLADVPTWKEQGVDAVLGQFRTIFGPKGMSKAQIKYWEKVFLKVHETDEWQKIVGKNFGVGDFLKSKETKNFLKSQYGEMKALAKDLGLLK